ncbi:zinc ribbon domain-containing protein [Nostoc favosum]|uniref:zinc ribbon domain-containing protein n=1 Tax=Nostoc favosum TaxID=2907819 RepID=UPI003F68A6ED
MFASFRACSGVSLSSINSSFRLRHRTHVCKCGCVLQRDHNASINILNIGKLSYGRADRK